MLVFGVDVPLIEILVALGIITFIILIEGIVIVALLMKQHQRQKKQGELLNQLSQTLLELTNRR